jgi:hypothetical protein
MSGAQNQFSLTRAAAKRSGAMNSASTRFRRMRQTVEDIEDARTIERAKSAHGKKLRIPWSQVRKEAGLD